MSIDIAMLLDMDNLDGSTGTSPSRTLYSSPLDPPRLRASVVSSPKTTTALLSETKQEFQTPKTPESRTHFQLVARTSEHLPSYALTWNAHIQPSSGYKHYIQVSVSPNRRSTYARTVFAGQLSTPSQIVPHDESFAIPGSTTAAGVVSSSESLYLRSYGPNPSTQSHTGLLVPSPTRINDDLQWQMYLTPSLSNPLNEMTFDDIQHSPLSLSYPSDGAISTSHPVSVVDPFDVFNPSPYESKITARSMLTVNRHEAEESSVNDQTLAIPNGTYAALMELTPPTFDFGSARFSSLEAPSAHNPNASPSSIGTPSLRQRERSPTISKRGLSGWENDLNSNQLNFPLSALKGTYNGRKRRRSTPTSPIAPRRAHRSSTATSSNPEGNGNALQRFHSHAARNSKSKKQKPSASNVVPELGIESDNDNYGSGSNSDSDDYHPSRSASPVPNLSATSLTHPDPVATKRLYEGSFDEMDRFVSKKKTRRGKGKAKGSAALALAVVTQLGMKSQSHSLGAGNGDDDDDDSFDALALYKQGKTGIRKRKNNPIPLPVPIPNLNKKSRGRKVPYVADVDSLNSLSRSHSVTSSSNSSDMKEGSVEAKTELEGSSAEDLVPKGRRAKRKSSGPGSQANAEEFGGVRSYVCVVAGCGKCFVRGEHLKRHVRSIHTHDKPHPCPYEGCDKSFSRRDNLGQHVRIHLQP